MKDNLRAAAQDEESKAEEKPEIQTAPIVRLVDAQKMYSDIMKDAARRAVIDKNTYPGGRKPEHVSDSTGSTGVIANSKRNRAQRALYENSSKRDPETASKVVKVAKKAEGSDVLSKE